MAHGRVRRAALAVLTAPMLAACSPGPGAASGEREERAAGVVALEKYGCGSCHRIPGVAGAHGDLGPPLVQMADRVYIGRGLPNTPENMRRWIQSPQSIAPGTAMPDQEVSAHEARVMTTYLLGRE